MLLGDRSFVESDTVTAFQKIAAYHVLVVAGLHVGALILFLFWLCRRLRLSAGITSLVTLAILAAYAGVVQDHKVAGARFDWDGVTGEFLWPADTGPVHEASNDDSLVLRITDGRMHFLLPGDAQQRSEDELVGKHAPLAADFLKLPHHGSKTSSTEAFLAAVAPRVAVVSVGDANPFGRPAETIIERYAHDGVRLLRTDRDGAVTALTDGQNLSVQTFLERHKK